MKRLALNLIYIIFLLLIILLTTLSTIGINTNKFNKLISDKISETKNVDLELSVIQFKLDPNELSLFLETKEPRINYKNLSIPVQTIKVYIDFISLLKSKLIVKKTNIVLEELDVIELNKLSKIIKPSNFKSFLNNKIKEGTLTSEIEIYLDKDGLLKDYIARGEIKNLKTELINNLNLIKTNFSFFAD